MTLNRGSISPTICKTMGLVETKSGIWRQHITLLSNKITLAEWTKILSQALRHLNDQPVGPVALYACLGILAKAPSTVKLWKWWEKTIAQALAVDQPVMLLRTPSPITPGNYLLEFATGHLTQIRDFAPLGERELFNLLWDLIVLLQAGPVETHGTRNGTHNIERGEKVGVLIWYISPPAHRLMPESAACPGSVYGVHKQASFLKLSIPVSSALGGHVLFPTGTHRGALTKFT